MTLVKRMIKENPDIIIVYPLKKPNIFGKSDGVKRRLLVNNNKKANN